VKGKGIKKKGGGVKGDTQETGNFEWIFMLCSVFSALEWVYDESLDWWQYLCLSVWLHVFLSVSCCVLMGLIFCSVCVCIMYL
jgi:hypothetical protein